MTQAAPVPADSLVVLSIGPRCKEVDPVGGSLVSAVGAELGRKRAAAVAVLVAAEGRAATRVLTCTLAVTEDRRTCPLGSFRFAVAVVVVPEG